MILANCYSVSSQETGEGICILWNDNVDLSIIYSSFFFIDTNISFDLKSWRFTGFYGHPEAHKRNESWNVLRPLTGSNNNTWLVGGDLNEVMWQKRKKKGGNLRNLNQLLGFRNNLDVCGLSDLGFIGEPFTWCNKWKNKDPISCRLDIFLGKHNFTNLFINISNLHLDWCRSNHRPIELFISVSTYKKIHKSFPRSFKFEEHWTNRVSCSDIIKEATGWNANLNNPSSMAFSINKVASNLNNWGLPISSSISKNISNGKFLLKKAYSNPIANFTEILDIKNTLDSLLSEE